MVVIMCLDCESVEKIDSIWQVRADAMVRVKKLDHSIPGNRRMADIQETVAIG